MGLTAMGMAEARDAALSDLQVARARAVRGGAPVVVQVAPDRASYGWTGWGPRRLASFVRIQGPATPIGFYPDGSALGGTWVLAAGARRVQVSVTETGVIAAGSVRGG
jgi:hypothetical protein